MSEAGYKQGLLLWKLYVQNIGLEKDEDEDEIDFSAVTAEEVFYGFDEKAKKELIKPNVTIAEEETKH